MHEITLCQRALELIEQQAVQNHAKRVTGVWLTFPAVEALACALSLLFILRSPK